MPSLNAESELFELMSGYRRLTPSGRHLVRLSYGRDGRIDEALGDLPDIQTKALEEGIPYQTLIASVLHKYVSGRLTERPVPSTAASRKNSTN